MTAAAASAALQALDRAADAMTGSDDLGALRLRNRLSALRLDLHRHRNRLPDYKRPRIFEKFFESMQVDGQLQAAPR